MTRNKKEPVFIFSIHTVYITKFNYRLEKSSENKTIHL